MICSVPNCGRKAVARGWCQGHWQRWRDHGDLKSDQPLTKSHPGAANSHWKGGIQKSRGRTYVYCPGHPYANRHGCVARYRLEMENKLGRYLTPEEIVHHEGTLEEDVSEKLKVMTQSRHARLHFGKTSTEMLQRVRSLYATLPRYGSLPRIARETGLPLRRVKSIVYEESWKGV